MKEIIINCHDCFNKNKWTAATLDEAYQAKALKICQLRIAIPHLPETISPIRHGAGQVNRNINPRSRSAGMFITYRIKHFKSNYYDFVWKYSPLFASTPSVKHRINENINSITGSYISFCSM